MLQKKHTSREKKYYLCYDRSMPVEWEKYCVKIDAYQLSGKSITCFIIEAYQLSGKSITCVIMEAYQ